MNARKSEFLSPLRVEQVTEDDWILLESLKYYSAGLERTLVIPKGFVTDFASVPRLPFIYWFTGGKASGPAVLHDYFYRTNTEVVPRAAADALLAEAMEVRGYWRVRTWFMWAGVRVGGHWSYETRSKKELVNNSESEPLTVENKATTAEVKEIQS